MPAFAGAGIQFGCEGNLSRIHSWSLDTIVDLLSCTSHSPLQFCKASKAPHRLHSGQGEGRVLANFHLERHLLVALWLTSGYLILRLSSSSLQSRMFVSKVKSSLPRCQSDSVLVQPSTSRSASVDPAAAWRAEKHFTSKLRIIFACKSRELVAPRMAVSFELQSARQYCRRVCHQWVLCCMSHSSVGLVRGPLAAC